MQPPLQTLAWNISLKVKNSNGRVRETQLQCAIRGVNCGVLRFSCAVSPVGCWASEKNQFCLLRHESIQFFASSFASSACKALAKPKTSAHGKGACRGHTCVRLLTGLLT